MTQVMTEQEKQEVIEKAAKVARESYGQMLGEPRLARWHDADSRPAWMKTTEAALEAVDYFTLCARLDALVEAGDRLLARAVVMEAEDGNDAAYEGFLSALTAAKEQTND